MRSATEIVVGVFRLDEEQYHNLRLWDSPEAGVFYARCSPLISSKKACRL